MSLSGAGYVQPHASRDAGHSAGNRAVVVTRPRSVMFDGPAVVVSGRFAYWLERTVNLRRLALDVRGSDAELTEALHAIHLAALTFEEQAASATGRKQETEPEVTPESTYVTTPKAADLLGCTDRAVRLACSEGRLSGRCIDGRWRVDRQDLERFKELRNP